MMTLRFTRLLPGWNRFLEKEVSVLGYLVTSKPVHTVKNETMFFHTFIDAAGDWLDTIFFPPTARKYNVTGRGFYSMKGKVVEEFGVYSVDVSFCKKVGIKERGGGERIWCPASRRQRQ